MRSVDNLLLIGCRKRDDIQAYDIRRLKAPLLQINFARTGEQTPDQRLNYGNQRYYFDVDIASKTLYTGNPLGQVIGYNLTSNESSVFYAAHFEGIPAISYSNGLLATGSGSRTFVEQDSDDESSSNDSRMAEEIDLGFSEGTRLWRLSNL